MNSGNYVLCIEKSNLQSINNLRDVVFKPSNSIWVVTFADTSVKLKTIWAFGETCILFGTKAVDLNKYASYAQDFNKRIHSVYEIDRKDVGCPYGATLVIFSDMTIIWTSYGSEFRYIGVNVGYLSQSNVQLAKEIGWF